MHGFSQSSSGRGSSEEPFGTGQAGGKKKRRRRKKRRRKKR
jgi:hypothetical protein